MSIPAIDSLDVEHILRTASVLRAATNDDIHTILGMGVQRRVEAGDYFIFEGQPADYVLLLLSGHAKLCQTTPDGQLVNVRTIVPGQLFGAIGAVEANASYPVCAQALEDSSALAISSEAFHRLLEERPHLAFGFMRLMTGYIQEMQDRYREMATEKVERRLAHVLLRLARQTGKEVEEGVVIELPFSRQDLAEMAGTTLYTVSRILSAWERRELIATGRERIILSRPHAIVCIAEGLEVSAGK